MSKAESYKCDAANCTSRKGALNKWWIMRINEGALSLWKWSDSDAALPGVLHVCGVSCASRIQDQFTQDILGGK